MVYTYTIRKPLRARLERSEGALIMAGYNWGAGKSNTAVWAEDVEGQVTKS